MTSAEYRQAWRERIAAGLQERFTAAEVPAAFEGGSMATGRADEWSDLDLYVVAEPVLHEEVFAALEQLIQQQAAITHRWHVADLPWPGTSQRFYFLAGAPRFFVLDCLALARESVAQFLEPERHGNRLALFDREDLLRPVALDHPRHTVRLRRRLEQIRASWPLYRMLVEKELARDHPLDALGFYLALLRMTLELAGAVHRPERFDFGWRYLHVDLPADLQRELESLAFGVQVADLPRRLDQLDALHARLLKQLPAELEGEAFA